MKEASTRSLSAESQGSLRVTPVSAGGDQPAVRFDSKSEERPFTVAVTKEQARDIGRFLYTEVDIVALVKCDEEGFIE